MKEKISYYYLLILVFTGININSSTATTDNAIPFNGFANVWTHFYDVLKSYMKNDPTTNQQLASFLGKENALMLKELIDPLENILNETSRFGTALKTIIKSPGLEQLMNTGEIPTENYLESLGVSRSCLNDLKLIVDGIINRKDWALRMLDAFGKPGSNLMDYEIKWLGSYDECLAVKAKNQHNTSNEMVANQEYFSGKYCTISVKAGNVPQNAMVPQPTVDIGACVSDTCSATDIKVILKAAVLLVTQNDTLEGPNVICQEKRTLDAPAIVAICILVVLVMLIVLGTAYDVFAVQMRIIPTDKQQQKYNASPFGGNSVNNTGFVAEPETSKIPLEVDTSLENHESKMSETVENATGDLQQTNCKSKEISAKHAPKGVIEQILLSFSAYTNGTKLLSVRQSSGSLGAVNGIRFLSMAWIILGHTYNVGIVDAENLRTFLLQQLYSWPFMGILYSEVSVDTFFVLSGLLVAYLTLKELEKVGGVRRFNWIMFYFHRFWRLTPAYMLVMMVFGTLTKYWSSGPLWNLLDGMVDNCKDVWWSHLLYVNNFVNIDKPCITWAWYLANDMQFYVISPLLFIPLFYHIAIGGVVSVLFLVATSVSTGLIVMNHHYPVQKGPLIPKPDDRDYGKLVYDPCYTRMGPYIVGLFTGYLLYKMKCKCRIPKVGVLLGWLISLAICSAVIYGPYTDKDSHIFSMDESIAYFAIHRTAWGIAISWIVFACATGHGGWINVILSWKAFIPLARLTYCAYLVHPIVQIVYFLSRRQLAFLNNYEMIYLYLGNLVMSYGAAYVTSLAFESPMMGLEKAIFKRDRRS